MCCKHHKCFITVEALTSSGSVNLPDSTRIRNGKVTSIQLRRSGALTLKTSKGVTVATDAVIGTGHLILKDSNGTEITSPLPLSSLQRDYTSPEPLAVSWVNVDLTQSNIVFDASVVNAAHAVEITFGLDCDNC